MRVLSCKQTIKPQIDGHDLYQHLPKAGRTAPHPQLPLDSFAGAEAPLSSEVRILSARTVIGESTHMANWNESKVCICRCGHVIRARREAFDVANGILPQGRGFAAA